MLPRAVAQKRREGKVEACVDQIVDWRDHKLVDSVDCVERHVPNPVHGVHGGVPHIVDRVHGQVPHPVGGVHGHVPSHVHGVHHALSKIVSHVHGHVHHVLWVQHAEHVGVGGVPGVLAAEPWVGVGAGGAAGTVPTRAPHIVHAPPEDVAGLAIIARVQTDIELLGPETRKTLRRFHRSRWCFIHGDQVEDNNIYDSHNPA